MSDLDIGIITLCLAALFALLGGWERAERAVERLGERLERRRQRRIMAVRARAAMEAEVLGRGSYRYDQHTTITFGPDVAPAGARVTPDPEVPDRWYAAPATPYADPQRQWRWVTSVERLRCCEPHRSDVSTSWIDIDDCDECRQLTAAAMMFTDQSEWSDARKYNRALFERQQELERKRHG